MRDSRLGTGRFAALLDVVNQPESQRRKSSRVSKGGLSIHGFLISTDLDTGLLGPTQPRKIALPTYVRLPADSQSGDDALFLRMVWDSNHAKDQRS
jgi:hypothetical protein